MGAGYPRETEERLELAGAPVLVRPIRMEDAPAERAFIAHLSPESAYKRFMMPVHELPEAMIDAFVHVDYARSMAFVALEVGKAGKGDGEREGEGEGDFIGVARYAGDADGQRCEFAVTIADAWQGRGLGTLLLAKLMRYAARRGYREMFGFVLRTNRPMLALAHRLGFHVDPQGAGESATVRTALTAAAPLAPR